VSDHPRDCPHGRQWGKCDTCDLATAHERIIGLVDENKQLQAERDYAALEYKREHALRMEIEAEAERLRAVAEAARWVTPYIPEIGEVTFCHPMHHGYHNGQLHTVYVTTREQEQFGKWAEDFVDALAALEAEVGE
jgi:hypothetical protein